MDVFLLVVHDRIDAYIPGQRIFGIWTIYHSIKADLKVGDLLETHHSSNYGEGKKANYVYMTATLDTAMLGA